MPPVEDRDDAVDHERVHRLERHREDEEVQLESNHELKETASARVALGRQNIKPRVRALEIRALEAGPSGGPERRTVAKNARAFRRRVGPRRDVGGLGRRLGRPDRPVEELAIVA